MKTEEENRIIKEFGEKTNYFRKATKEQIEELASKLSSKVLEGALHLEGEHSPMCENPTHEEYHRVSRIYFLELEKRKK